MNKENNTVLNAPREMYEIEISNEEGLLDVSIYVDKNIEDLDLIAIAVKREFDGQSNFAAILDVSSREERKAAHILTIPETEIDQYSFIITYLENVEGECALSKRFKIPITY